MAGGRCRWRRVRPTGTGSPERAAGAGCRGRNDTGGRSGLCPRRASPRRRESSISYAGRDRVTGRAGPRAGVASGAAVHTQVVSRKRGRDGRVRARGDGRDWQRDWAPARGTGSTGPRTSRRQFGRIAARERLVLGICVAALAPPAMRRGGAAAVELGRGSGSSPIASARWSRKAPQRQFIIGSSPPIDPIMNRRCRTRSSGGTAVTTTAVDHASTAMGVSCWPRPRRARERRVDGSQRQRSVTATEKRSCWNGTIVGR
jgi:hypothetical protein